MLFRTVFLTQGSNWCLLHWQADSLPLSHQGSPVALGLEVESHSVTGRPGGTPFCHPGALNLLIPKLAQGRLEVSCLETKGCPVPFLPRNKVPQFALALEIVWSQPHHSTPKETEAGGNRDCPGPRSHCGQSQGWDQLFSHPVSSDGVSCVCVRLNACCSSLCGRV